MKKSILLLITIILVFYMADWVKDRLPCFLYPLNYQQEVVEAGETMNVDPALIFALIREESRFDKKAVSQAGAQGLMQLMPATAKWVHEKLDLPGSTTECIWNPHDNILMGSWYLKWLLDYYHNDQIKAIAAYNAGLQNVDSWLSQGIWDGSLLNAKDIPFAETAKHVRVVFKSKEQYEKLYDL